MAKTDDIRNTNPKFHAHENETSSSEQTKIIKTKVHKLQPRVHIVSIA